MFYGPQRAIYLLGFIAAIGFLSACSAPPPEDGPDANQTPREVDGDTGLNGIDETADDATDDADDDVLDEYPYGHCGDGVLSGDETDVDCGGSCIPCTTGQTCKVRRDCTTLHCDQEEMICASQGCADHCSFLGTCEEGFCECQPGWTGSDCSEPACLNDCSGNGRCLSGDCDCDAGWTGMDCSQATGD